MLSRVADNLYWITRYLERAEHTARMLDLNLHQMLDQTPESAARRWQRVYAALRMPPPVDTPNDAYHVTNSLTFDLSNDVSIVSYVMAARENARQVREQISTEMWEQLNQLCLHIRRTKMDDIWQSEPHEFFQTVKNGAHLFHGITNATICHNEGWHYLRLGRFIERAVNTAALLNSHLAPIIESQRMSSEPLDYLELVGVLKSCTAFEAYCQIYTADIRPHTIAEFLLLSAECPRSVRFAVEMVQATLQAVAHLTGVGKSGRAERIAGRLRATLEYGQVDEIIADDLHTFLEDIQGRCTQIHTAIHQTYIAYPIDSVLAS